MTTKTLTIGVSGASGKLGSATLRELKARANGARIVAISRTPGNVQDADETRVGDYDAPETLAAAYAGIDRLLIIPSGALRPGVRGVQNVAAIDAAVAAGVGQIVFLSSAGAHDVEEPNILASYYRAEQRLARTAPAWSVLRMNYYAEAFVQEAQSALASGAIVGFAENRVAFVSRDDIAAAAAGVLLGEGHEGATYNLTGPVRWSGAERAQAVAEASGVQVGFAVVPKDAFAAGMRGMGLPDDVVNAVVSIQENFVAGAFDIVTGDVERLSGKPPRAFQEMLRDAFGGSR